MSGIGDSGYIGTRLQVPDKKPPNGQLTAEQKRANRALSRRRIAAEWSRNPLKRHAVMMKNVAGLHHAMVI